MKNICISGFADEICPDFTEQLKTVTALGMQYICLRSANGKTIVDYTLAEAEAEFLPPLQAAGVGVSSIGSSIGKIKVNDEEAFATQLAPLEPVCQICKLFDCRYIRLFSFLMPEGEDPANYTEMVIEKLSQFIAIATAHDIILLHENEKHIYGDIGTRCRLLMDRLYGPYFKSAFDFANFVQCADDTVACWELLKDTVAYIHIKDARAENNENVLFGTGDGKVAQLLKQAICEDGYTGFLTLEPHLVIFGTLVSLEKASAEEIIKKNKYPDGATGYSVQYHALCDILKSFGGFKNICLEKRMDETVK